MKVLLTGGTGFIGSQLISTLLNRNYRVSALVRNVKSAQIRLPKEVELFEWKSADVPIYSDCAKDVEAVLHLAGEPIANGRWSEKKKFELLHSRVGGAERLLELFRKHPGQLKTFISASAIGFYGNRGDELLGEDAKPGNDFLADLTKKWEASAEAFHIELGARVVCVRTGLVLGENGGALEKMLPAFKLGLGGPLGSGKQWMSWIHLDDLISIYIRALEDASLRGPVNAVAPNPVRNSEFAKCLGRVVRRPAFVPMPSFALRGLFGEMADMLLGGARVSSRLIESKGLRFHYSDLREALSASIGTHEAKKSSDVSGRN